jgi:hypothetical protein
MNDRATPKRLEWFLNTPNGTICTHMHRHGLLFILSADSALGAMIYLAKIRSLLYGDFWHVGQGRR